MIYALDSNIVSYMLRDNDTVYEHYADALTNGYTCVLPLITYYEVLRGLLANDSHKLLGLFEDFCNDIDIIDLSVTDMVTAARIYANRKKIGRPIDDSDLLIAAQCVSHQYTLVTNNTRHFANIDGLKIVDWTQA